MPAAGSETGPGAAPLAGHHKYAFVKDLNKGSYGFVQVRGGGVLVKAETEMLLCPQPRDLWPCHWHLTDTALHLCSLQLTRRLGRR